jgi:hypothetical protein
MEREREAELLARRALSICEQKLSPTHLLEDLTGQHTGPGQSGSGVVFLYEKSRSSPIQENDAQRQEPWVLQASETLAARQLIPPTFWQTIPAAAESEPDEDRKVDFCETFLQECCTFSDQACCRVADLWQAYQAWALKQEAEVSLSRQTLTSCLKAKGCSPARTNTSRTWHGLDLKTHIQEEMYNVSAEGNTRETKKLT